jgi:hypothetical protein
MKYVTSYFRHGFSLFTPVDLATLELRLRRDDGAIVYINGVEVARSNMPAGAVTYTTLASQPVEDNDLLLFSVPPQILLPGTNVIAAEVHQNARNSSDLSFDLALMRGELLPAGGGVPLLAAGDIGDCNTTNDTATGLLLDAQPGRILTLGDAAYPSGSATDFANCFDPVWGRHKSRISPAPGNHEYMTPGASGYFDYFGAAAGDPAKGYYSFDIDVDDDPVTTADRWHIVALNTNCGIVSCAAGSEQEQWLRNDLRDNPHACTLAFSHHPRFSTGEHGNTADVAPLWNALLEAGAEILLSGHDHDYERWTAVDAAGASSPSGVVQFVVGTGGTSLRDFPAAAPLESRARGRTAGVLRLMLRPTDYDWEFLPIAGATFVDRGRGVCH